MTAMASEEQLRTPNSMQLLGSTTPGTIGQSSLAHWAHRHVSLFRDASLQSLKSGVIASLIRGISFSISLLSSSPGFSRTM